MTSSLGLRLKRDLGRGAQIAVGARRPTMRREERYVRCMVT